MRRKVKHNQPELVKSDLSKKRSQSITIEKESLQEGEEVVYEIVEREILPEKIICPDCGGITTQGLEFCDKCGGELNS